MSRWTPNKPMEQVTQVNMPFSRKDGHRVGDGRKAARDDARAALEEMRNLAREARDAQADIRARVRGAVWTVAVCSAATVGSFLYALARIGAL